MTVNELIQKLRTFDGNLRVVTHGFDESDFEDVDIVEEMGIEFHDERAKFHGGRHKASRKEGCRAIFVDST